ncbi:MAG: DNA-processing protein DprA [Clostridia bacterium]|nr:DNA-processing protein DprA [Clostridia bacterium]
MSDHTLYTLWLLLNGKPATHRTGALLQHMTAAEAYHADKETLCRYLSEKDAAYFLNKDLAPAMKVSRECEEKNIRMVCYHDKEYPPSLREIDNPPAMLFCLGHLPEPNLPTVGIVGTRNCSRTGAALAATFSCSLTLSGFQIVSGMANGIDTYAHKGPLIKGYPSFAVLGCGVDVIYPKQNEELYNILKQHGGLISEYPPGTKPFPGNFPPRNRIISGLSDGVLVVECPPKSGSMSTARYAIEQNRTLFAVPAGPNERINTGTNNLIKNGAVFCTEPDDIFREFQPRFADRITPTVVRFRPAETEEPTPPEPPPPRKEKKAKKPSPPKPSEPPRPRPSLSPEEEKVFNAFSEGEILSADDIGQRTDLPFHRLLPILQGLELAGCIEPLPGSMFRRK